MHTTSQHGWVVATNKLGMRRSCDDCARKKKKCDGSTPCSRCRRKGDRCMYSKRRPHLPPQQSRRQHQPTVPAGTHHAADALRHSTSGAALHGMLPFKRCRLSASPATGFVGMRENAFLSDFFGCVGFLPLTTQSEIRETMVNIMAHPKTQQPINGVGHTWSEASAAPDAIVMGGGLSTALGRKHLPVDPPTCIFWCAVALGALVKGCPVESVAAYCRLASDALGTYSGPPNTEVAKAWAILAHLHSFTGNTAKFQEHLELLRSFLDASLEQETSGALPVGFVEMIQHTETVKVCFGYAEPGEIEQFCARRLDPPQLNAAADEWDLYRYYMHSFSAFEQSIFVKACERSAAAAGGSPQDADSGEEGNSSSSSSGRYLDGPLLSEVPEAMATALQDHVVSSVRIKEAADRPSIRRGIGGLVINAALVFDEASKGNADGTLERIARIVEVYERYPGLCRCMMRWDNIAHVMLAALAALDCTKAGELYGRLRAAYNPHRPPDSLPVPPLEEWQGISAFCEDFHCWSLERLMAGRAFSVFSIPLGPEGEECEASMPLSCSERNHSGASVAAVFAEEMRDPIPVGSCAGEAELSETATGPCPSAQVDRAARPAPFAPHPRDGQEIGPDIYLTHSGGGQLIGLIGAPELQEFGGVDGLNDDAGDDGVAAADWFDVTLAMLGAVDDPTFSSR